MDAVLKRLSKLLYGQHRNNARVPIAEIVESLSDLKTELIEDAIQELDRHQLLRISFQRDSIDLTPTGKLAYEKDCVAEICLGSHYIASEYRAAFVHISVQDSDGDLASGTGFFVADFPGWIGTAKHVVEHKRITAIESETCTVICTGESDIRLAPDDLDLALIRCKMPNQVRPMRIDWEHNSVRELDEILVAGFPPIAHHLPALTLSTGTVNSIAPREKGPRRSLIISRITEPGYSGGPVISSRGLVVGVVEQENEFTRKDGERSIFIGATPSYYFGEIP